MVAQYKEAEILKEWQPKEKPKEKPAIFICYNTARNLFIRRALTRREGIFVFPYLDDFLVAISEIRFSEIPF